MRRDFEYDEAEQRDFSELEEGKTYILDKGCCNESIVTIKFFYGMYARIKDVQNQEWDVMIFRLSQN